MRPNRKRLAQRFAQKRKERSASTHGEVLRTPWHWDTVEHGGEMGYPWASDGQQSSFAAQRQSRANGVVARAAARAESLSNEISDLRGSRQRAAENFGEYELADIKWRASNIKAGRRHGSVSMSRARHPDGAAAPLQRMSHSDAQARGVSTHQRNGSLPCGRRLDQARRRQQQQHQQPPPPDQNIKLPQFQAFRSHTADPDLSERQDLDDSRRRARRDRRTRREGGGGGRRRTIGGLDEVQTNAQNSRRRPRKGPVIPRLDLSRLAKYQVGHEQEEKQLVRKKKTKKKEQAYSYHEENSFYLPRDESTAPPPAQWQDASQYLQDVDFENDDSFRKMAQHTY